MADLAILRAAYLQLLQLSHGMPRTRLQGVLAALVSEIALLEGRSAEAVQNEAEAMADWVAKWMTGTTM